VKSGVSEEAVVTRCAASLQPETIESPKKKPDELTISVFDSSVVFCLFRLSRR
jgi:hypothetical protein